MSVEPMPLWICTHPVLCELMAEGRKHFSVTVSL